MPPTSASRTHHIGRRIGCGPPPTALPSCQGSKEVDWQNEPKIMNVFNGRALAKVLLVARAGDC